MEQQRDKHPQWIHAKASFQSAGLLRGKTSVTDMCTRRTMKVTSLCAMTLCFNSSDREKDLKWLWWWFPLIISSNKIKSNLINPNVDGWHVTIIPSISLTSPNVSRKKTPLMTNWSSNSSLTPKLKFVSFFSFSPFVFVLSDLTAVLCWRRAIQ